MIISIVIFFVGMSMGMIISSFCVAASNRDEIITKENGNDVSNK